VTILLIIKVPAVLFRVFFLGTIEYLHYLERITDNPGSIFLAISFTDGVAYFVAEILADAEKRYAMAMAHLWGW